MFARPVFIPFQHKDFHACWQFAFVHHLLEDTTYYDGDELMEVDFSPTDHLQC